MSTDSDATRMARALSPPMPSALALGHGTSFIEKLEGASNFSSWKFSIKMALILDGVWDQIEAAENTIDPVRNQRALARICLSLKTSLFQYVRDANTAKDAWTKLSDVFESRGLYRKVLLLRQLHGVKYSSYSDMSEYISAVMILVQQLADIGKIIDDEEVAELLLSGLPEEYDSLVSALETACMASALNSEIVRSRLLQEAHRKNESNNNNTAFMSTKQKSTKVCHYCSRPGHIKAKCFKLKRDKKNENKETKVSAFLVSTSSKNDNFYIDSGASYHMCNSLYMMVNVKNTKNYTISVANNEKLTSNTQGDVHLLINKEVRVLNNVLFVPNLSANLISVSQLINDGFSVCFDKNGCKISCKVTGNIIATGSCINGIYRFNGVVCELKGYTQSRTHSLLLHDRQESPSAAAADMSLDLWHKRLGHLSISGMCKFQGMATGMSFQKPEARSVKDCVACLVGKQTAEPFPKGEAKRANKPLELVHSDVCGPIEEASWGGAKYLVTFTDDYSRKTYGYLMRCKSQVRSIGLGAMMIPTTLSSLLLSRETGLFPHRARRQLWREVLCLALSQTLHPVVLCVPLVTFLH